MIVSEDVDEATKMREDDDDMSKEDVALRNFLFVPLFLTSVSRSVGLSYFWLAYGLLSVGAEEGRQILFSLGLKDIHLGIHTRRIGR